MVSQNDFEKQHNLCQKNVINVKESIEAPSNMQLANVRAEIKRNRVFKCEEYAKKGRKIYFQGSVKNRRVDRIITQCHSLSRQILWDAKN